LKKKKEGGEGEKLTQEKKKREGDWWAAPIPLLISLTHYRLIPTTVGGGGKKKKKRKRGRKKRGGGKKDIAAMSPFTYYLSCLISERCGGEGEEKFASKREKRGKKGRGPLVLPYPLLICITPSRWARGRGERRKKRGCTIKKGKEGKGGCLDAR